MYLITSSFETEEGEHIFIDISTLSRTLLEEEDLSNELTFTWATNDVY